MQNFRRHLGQRFSEGSRLLWLALGTERLSIAQAAARLGWHRGNLARALYGDSKPGIDALVVVEQTFAVPVGAWAVEPTETFVPPALEEEGAA